MRQDSMPNERRPNGEFSPLIEKYWLSPRAESSGQNTMEFFPDGHFALGFVLGNGGCRLFIGGPNTRPIQVTLPASLEYFQVRFRPGKLPRLVDVKPAELVNRIAEGFPRVLGEDADSLGERLYMAESIEAKQRIVEELFRRGRMESTFQDKRCRQAVEMIESRGGHLKVAEVAREFGTSARTLERVFLDQVGLTPKQFIRNIRLQKMIGKLTQGNSRSSLTTLAHECGFADQSHCIKEFRALTRKLPSAFHFIS